MSTKHKGKRKKTDPLFLPIKFAIVAARNELRLEAKLTTKTSAIHRRYLKLKAANRKLGLGPLANIIDG